MLPKITQLEMPEQTLPQVKIGKSFLFDFRKGDFILKNGKVLVVEEIEALKIWIEKTIRTEKFKFRIYDNTEYGVTLEDLLGSNFPQVFIEAEIKREVTSTLVQHPYIQNISRWKFTRDGSLMTIFFQVITIEGAFEQEVTFNG
ncbi:DUF2634 domain-containing protein [Bacillus tianshenii]|nr:DUF2634 domain-containing protein [Bacillus tianshenii]